MVGNDMCLKCSFETFKVFDTFTIFDTFMEVDFSYYSGDPLVLVLMRTSINCFPAAFLFHIHARMVITYV